MTDQAAYQLLSKYSVALISDCLDRLHVVDAAIKPISHRVSFCGPAYPVQEYAGLNCTLHLAAAQLPAGHVLMVNALGYEQRAVWGRILNFVAATRDAVAVVIDGAVRDVRELRESPFPVFARAVTAAGPLKGELGTCNQPTSVGGVVVQPGDIIRGDDDGIVVVPRDRVEATIEACVARAILEEKMVEHVKTHKMTELGESLLS